MKNFENKVPELALTFPNTFGMVSVLDGLYDYKISKQDHFFRVYNTVLSPFRKYLTTRLYDMGFPLPGFDVPLVILHSLVLNGADIMSYRGSPEGVKLFLQACTLGKVTADYTDYFPYSLAISPDDPLTGFLPFDLATDESWFVHSPDTESLDSSLDISIETYFSDNSGVKKYISSSIEMFLPFFEGNAKDFITYSPGRIRGVEKLHYYLDFGFNECVVTDLFYGIVKSLYNDGYTTSFQCAYETLKGFYSEPCAGENYSLPLTNENLESIDVVADASPTPPLSGNFIINQLNSI